MTNNTNDWANKTIDSIRNALNESIAKPEDPIDVAAWLEEAAKEIHYANNYTQDDFYVERKVIKFRQRAERIRSMPVVAWMHPISGVVVRNDEKIPGVTLDDFNIPLGYLGSMPIEIENEKLRRDNENLTTTVEALKRTVEVLEMLRPTLKPISTKERQPTEEDGEWVLAFNSVTKRYTDNIWWHVAPNSELYPFWLPLNALPVPGSE